MDLIDICREFCPKKIHHSRPEPCSSHPVLKKDWSKIPILTHSSSFHNFLKLFSSTDSLTSFLSRNCNVMVGLLRWWCKAMFPSITCRLLFTLPQAKLVHFIERHPVYTNLSVLIPLRRLRKHWNQYCLTVWKLTTTQAWIFWYLGLSQFYLYHVHYLSYQRLLSYQINLSPFMNLKNNTWYDDIYCAVIFWKHFTIATFFI